FDGGRLVPREVMPRPGVDLRQDARHAVRLVARRRGRPFVEHRMGAVHLEDTPRHLRQGQHQAPVATALRGMPSNSASSGSCTITTPPRSRIARTPSAPSLPAPLSTTATAWPSKEAASVRKK